MPNVLGIQVWRFPGHEMTATIQICKMHQIDFPFSPFTRQRFAMWIMGDTRRDIASSPSVGRRRGMGCLEATAGREAGLWSRSRRAGLGGCEMRGQVTYFRRRRAGGQELEGK